MPYTVQMFWMQLILFSTFMQYQKPSYFSWFFWHVWTFFFFCFFLNLQALHSTNVLDATDIIQHIHAISETFLFFLCFFFFAVQGHCGIWMVCGVVMLSGTDHSICIKTLTSPQLKLGTRILEKIAGFWRWAIKVSLFDAGKSPYSSPLRNTACLLLPGGWKKYAEYTNFDRRRYVN